MNNVIRKALLLIVSILTSSLSYSQLTNYIYCITNPGTSIFAFEKIEIATGNLTNLVTLPISSISTLASSTVDVPNQKYFLCTGTKMLTLDPVNGTLLSNLVMPIGGNGFFCYCSFNNCDSYIYGLYRDASSIVHFAKYDPLNNTITPLGFSTCTSFCGGCMSLIDHSNNTYVLQNGKMYTYDITTGQEINSVNIVNIAGEQFGHIALDCASGLIFGTSANTTELVKYLATISPVTGVVTAYSQTSWTTGVWKPSIGGDVIDQNNHIFYYSGAGAELLGASTTTGTLLSDDTVQSAGEIMFVQHFSDCTCTIAGLSDPTADFYSISPNPFTDELTVYIKKNETCEIVIYDMLSEVVLKESFVGFKTLSIGFLPKGIYSYKIICSTNSSASGLLVH